MVPVTESGQELGIPLWHHCAVFCVLLLLTIDARYCCLGETVVPHVRKYSLDTYREQLLSHYASMRASGAVVDRDSVESSTTSPPSSSSPPSLAKRDKLCMVGIMADEELFLDEWLAYHHRVIGFDYFFLCDNGRNGSLALARFLHPHIKAGYLTVVDWQSEHAELLGENNQYKCSDMALFLMQDSKPFSPLCFVTLSSHSK